MLKRILSGVAMAGAGALMILATPLWVWFLLIVAISLRMNHELATILEAKGHRHARRMSTFFSILLLASTWTVLMNRDPGDEWVRTHMLTMTAQTATMVLAFLGSFCLFLLLDKPRATIGDVATTFLGIIYVGWFPTFFVLLRAMPDGPLRLFWVVVGAVMSDVGAYFAGRFFGKTPFFPQHSPKKTVEGAIGGFLLCVTVLTLTGPLVGVPTLQALLLSMLIGVVAPAGDLAESLLKRDAGVKDAGDLIPGHGGILDRFDSFLFAGPVAYFYLATFVIR